MTTILFKDAARQQVELASGGKQTVLYTAKGQPTYMNIVEKFDLSTVAEGLSGTHPAFIVNGIEKDVIYIGTYEASLRNGELLSLPDVAPLTNTSRTDYIKYARACGEGHHTITAAEWSAVMMPLVVGGVLTYGNTNYGVNDYLWWNQNIKSHGRRVDGGTLASDDGSDGTTYTGSGDIYWREAQKYNGISDFFGNTNTVINDLRCIRGELQVIQNSLAVLSTTNITPTSDQWRCINAVTGEFMVPDGNGTTANSVRYYQSGAVDYSIIAPTQSPFNQMYVAPAQNPVQTAALNVLKAYGMFPVDTTNLNGYAWIRSTLDAYAVRGGNFMNKAEAGISHIGLGDDYYWQARDMGTRTCYVEI